MNERKKRKMTMKKKLLTTLSVVLILGLAALGILAYLTDTDSDVNVMTLGEVDIEQTEIFEQGAPLDPGVTVEKKVTVENVGKSDAYVRTWFALEKPVTGIISWNGEIGDPVGDADIGGTSYSIYCLTYGIVPSGEKVTSLESVIMSKDATNADVAKYGDTYEVLVFSQAGQVTGFEDGTTPAEALDIMFGTTHPWDKALASTPAEAQAALDNAKSGDVIQLAPGVDYGTLYMRPSSGNAATKEVDWIGNNYRYESYSCFENITIVGTQGATVDAIVIEGGTYYNTPHSQDSTYPVMLSLIELKNVTIDGVTFTGEGGYDPQGHGNAINLTGHIKVNGLTLKNCTLENAANNARLIYRTEATTTEHKYAYDGETYTFVPDLKDIVVSGCTFNGGYMGLELRETENLTIVNNTFNGVASRDMLLPTNSGCTYSGTIEISNNKSIGAKERFIRGSGIGNATLIIKNNTVTDYQGADDDYIKVDGATGIIEVSGNTATAADASRTLTIKY